MAHVHGESLGYVATYGTLRHQQYISLHDTSETVRHTLDVVRDGTIGTPTENGLHTLHVIYMLKDAATKFISYMTPSLHPIDAELHHATANDDTARLPCCCTHG